MFYVFLDQQHYCFAGQKAAALEFTNRNHLDLSPNSLPLSPVCCELRALSIKSETEENSLVSPRNKNLCSLNGKLRLCAVISH